MKEIKATMAPLKSHLPEPKSAINMPTESTRKLKIQQYWKPEYTQIITMSRVSQQPFFIGKQKNFFHWTTENFLLWTHREFKGWGCSKEIVNLSFQLISFLRYIFWSGFFWWIKINWLKTFGQRKIFTLIFFFDNYWQFLQSITSVKNWLFYVSDFICFK